MSRAVVLATLISAVAQGLLAGIAYYVAGLQPVFLLIVLTMILSMVPFVGAFSVWVPACLWVYFHDEGHRRRRRPGSLRADCRQPGRQRRQTGGAARPFATPPVAGFT